MRVKKFFMVGFFLGILLVVMYIFSDLFGLTTSQRNASIVGGTIIISVSYVYLMYTRMMKDKDFKKEVLDERNVMIKEKTGYIMGFINNFLLAVAILAFILLDYIVPAIIVGFILGLQPIILIVISEKLERHF